VLRDPDTANSPDISKEPQNDLIGTVSRQPELEPAAAPIGEYFALVILAVIAVGDR
jgi:hypothetical protein